MRRIFCIGTLVLVQAAAFAGEAVLVQQGDTWDYFRGWSEPPWDWNQPGFDPSASGWESGPTGIGYADDDDATVLADMQNGYVSVYLRILVDVPASAEGYLWSFRFRYDDSFVAYIDGQEIARRGLTGTPPLYSDVGEDHEITTTTGFDEEILIADGASLLSAGEHVLAVQVHNSTLESSDLSFSAELTGGPFRVTDIEPGAGPIEGGNLVVLTGMGFDPGDVPSVLFGGVAATDVQVLSPTQLRARVPAAAGAGPVDVTVEDSRGAVVIPSGYRYTEPGQMGLQFGRNDYAQAVRYGDLFEEGTFEAWVKRGQDFFQRTRAVMSVQSNVEGDAMRVELRGGEFRAAAPNVDTLVASTQLEQDRWHHIAYVFSPAGRRLYLDGNLVGSDAVAVTLPEATGFRLGQSFGGTGGLTGIVESARVWKTARTVEEIRNYRFNRTADDPDIESFWALDEGAGQTSAHAGNLGNDLVLGSGTGEDESDPAWVEITDLASLAVSGVEPSSGPLAGGQHVRIYGGGFPTDRAVTVLFGAQMSPDVQVLQSWEIEAEVPAGVAYGDVDVTVRVGTLDVVAEGAYEYLPDNVEVVVAEGDPWWYFVATSEPPADWASVDFDPAGAAWLQGPTGIGYGDADDATDVEGVMLNVAAAVYATTEFQLEASADDVVFMKLRIRYDDGFVAYLNGVEVARRGMAGFPPLYTDLAELHEITVGAGGFDEEIDITGLASIRSGRNVLAVQVHNTTLDSTDLSMSAELVVASEGGSPEVTFIRGDTDRSGGSLTVTDAIKIVRYLFWGEDLSCLEAADVDDDGRIIVTDVIVPLRFLFQGDEPPPPPFPDPAPDADGDSLDCQS